MDTFYIQCPESLDLKDQMEQASLRPSPPGEADPPLQVNGAGPLDEEAEMKVSKAPPTGRRQGQAEAAEEVDHWETTVGPMYTMTRTAAAFSFATVQWDAPDTPPGRGGHPDPVDEEEEQEVIAGLEDCPSLRPFRDVTSTRRALPETRLPPDAVDICGSWDAAVEERALQEVEHPERVSQRVGEDTTSPDSEHEEVEEQGVEEEEVVPGKRGADSPPACALPSPEEVFLSTVTIGSGSSPPSSSPLNSVEGEEDDDHHCDEERGHPMAVTLRVCPGDAEALGRPTQADGDGELSEALRSNETLCPRPGGVAPEEPQDRVSALTQDVRESTPRPDPQDEFCSQAGELTSSAAQTAAPAGVGQHVIHPLAQRQPQPLRPLVELHPRQEETSLDAWPAETTEPRPPREGGGLEEEGGGGRGGGGTRQGGVRTSVSPGPPCPASHPESHHPTPLVLRPRTPEPSGAESHTEPPMGQSESSVSSGDPPPTALPQLQVNGGAVDRLKAQRLAHRLFHLEDVQRVDVVQYMDKDNEFSRAVGEEFLCFFDFSGQTLDNALRSFLTEVVLVGESQERERVLQHFSTRFHHCNPDIFSSPGAVLTLTCAMMLLNTDLHGQNVGKAMSTSSFVSNMEGMNEGQNFNKDLLRSFYNSIRGDPLQWAVDEEELKKQSMPQGEDLKEDSTLRSKSNPFQDVPHDRTARVFKQGFLQRKAHADIDGKRTPWGKRSWKTFYGVLKGLVLYFQKDAHRKGVPGEEEVVSLHHALAQEASDYTKKPHVFRLQTADWRVFLFQASSKAEMSSWICRINLVAALHSSPPFPAAVGSQRRFTRPILPASRSAQTLERQLTSHFSMLESFEKDLNLLQQSDGRKPRGREVEEHRVREDYLLHERSRYQGYLAVLEAWRNLNLLDGSTAGDDQLRLLDRAMFRNILEDIEEESEGLGMKKSVSSPSLELEMLPPVVKVRRNVSERRTYRRNIIARRNKDL